MNKLLLLLGLIMPTFLMGQYNFSAQVSSSDPCCISISAGAPTGSIYNTLWSVEVDGTIYDANDGKNFLHCVEGNGSYVVNFLVDGYDGVYWSRVVEITGCEGSCSECEIVTPNIIVAQDGCTTLICTAGNESYSSPCHSPTYSWDLGDGNTGTGSTYFHEYEDDGTYTACVTYSVINSDGDPCSTTACRDVVITDCTPPEPCCGFSLETPYVQPSPFPSFPCLGKVRIPSYGYDGACSGYDLLYDYDGDGVNDGTSSFHIFDGPGPHVVCVTLSYEGCELTKCSDPFTLPSCTSDDSGGGPVKGDIKSAISAAKGEVSFESIVEAYNAEDLNIYPNPTKDVINIDIPQGDDIVEVNILHTSGRTLLTQNIDAQTPLKIDVSTLPLGMYIIQTTDNEGNIKMKRFTKL